MLGIPWSNLNNWRLFLDSSECSLKYVQLHNGNVCTSVPIYHSVYLREEHDNIKTVIDQLKQHKHTWTTCVNLHMVKFSSWVHKKDWQSILVIFACGTAELEKSTGTRISRPYVSLWKQACQILSRIQLSTKQSSFFSLRSTSRWA